MAGPAGDAESDRAGEEGEYHHSKNLKKKMAVGRITLSESNKNWGDEKTKLRKNALNPAACCLTDEDAVEPILRCQEISGIASSFPILRTKSSAPSRRRSTPIQDNHGR